MNILMIDDDTLFCETLKDCFDPEEYTLRVAYTGQAGLDLFEKSISEIILLDQKLPDRDGVEVCKEIMKINPEVKIIFITGYPNYRLAVDAIQAGAFDYISKPIEIEELLLAVNKARTSFLLEREQEVNTYRKLHEIKKGGLIGNSLAMRKIVEQIAIAASSDVPVLITGETGVGKNVVAREIHKNRDEKGNVLTINCSAIPEQLIESELFGHEKGSFTGASGLKKGIFELSHNGTLVLDEIGEMPLHLQSKLLNVLEEKKLRRIGGTVSISVNPKIIALTNVKIEEAVRRRRFRQDLYYRLSTFRIHVSPLRERLDDLSVLSRLFLSELSKEPPDISDQEIERLQGYDWPGNVRELKNVIERTLLLHKGGEFRPSLFLHGISRDDEEDNPHEEVFPVFEDQPILPLDEIEKRAIWHALQKCDGKKSPAARALGISLNRLKRKLEKFGNPYSS